MKIQVTAEHIKNGKPTNKNTMRKIRLALAKWLWPKDVRQGELFTIVNHLRNGISTGDGSWVGDTCKADKVEGDTLPYFSRLNTYCEPTQYERISHPLIPGVNCTIKPIQIPMMPEQTKELYAKAKQLA